MFIYLWAKCVWNGVGAHPLVWISVVELYKSFNWEIINMYLLYKLCIQFRKSTVSPCEKSYIFKTHRSPLILNRHHKGDASACYVMEANNCQKRFSLVTSIDQENVIISRCKIPVSVRSIFPAIEYKPPTFWPAKSNIFCTGGKVDNND